MRRAFTLFELQVTLFLTVMVLSMLFLFTFYFQRNFYHYRETFDAQRDTQVFFDWLHQRASNSRLITSTENGIRFVDFAGVEHQLVIGEEGPSYDGVTFFGEPVAAEMKTDETDDGMEISVVLTWENRTQTFRPVYPKPAHLGLMEVAHEL